MSISNYAELKAAVGNWLHRTNLVTITPDLIMLGEKRIFRDVRVRAMEAALDLTIADGVAAVPADYVELKHAYVDGASVTALEVRSADYVYKKFPTRSATSRPSVIATDGDSFIFGPYPDSTYGIKGTYYKRLPAVSVEANDLFTANPDLYLFATLAEAAPYLKNDVRALVWETKYGQVKDAVNAEYRRAELSGGPLRMRTA